MTPRDGFTLRAAAGLVFSAALLITAVPARGAKLRDVFPEFQARRDSLGAVALLADVVVIRQVGGTPVFLRTRSLAYSDSALALFREMLERKGLRVEQSRLASMGITFSEDRGYRTADNDSTPATQLVNPPFFVDSLVGSAPGLEKSWRSLNRTLANYQRRKKDPPVSVAHASELAAAVGAGTIAVIRVVSWDVPIGKQLASLFSASSTMLKSSGFVGLTLVSAADGMIVWDDWVSQQGSMRLEALREKVKLLEANLP